MHPLWPINSADCNVTKIDGDYDEVDDDDDADRNWKTKKKRYVYSFGCHRSSSQKVKRNASSRMINELPAGFFVSALADISART